MKLKYEAFIELNSHLVEHFYQYFNPRKWHGFNLLSIDGTTVTISRIEAISTQFGAWKAKTR